MTDYATGRNHAFLEAIDIVERHIKELESARDELLAAKDFMPDVIRHCPTCKLYPEGNDTCFKCGKYEGFPEWKAQE